MHGNSRRLFFMREACSTVVPGSPDFGSLSEAKYFISVW
jgi:hypothetical protein